MSTKKVLRTRRKYDSSFKEDVLKMISSGRPISEVSQALGVSASLLHRWYKSAQSVSPNPGKNVLISPASQHNSFAEIERLKAELRRTEQERDILKKALGIFSRGTGQ
jgi:transposase